MKSKVIWTTAIIVTVLSLLTGGLACKAPSPAPAATTPSPKPAPAATTPSPKPAPATPTPSPKPAPATTPPQQVIKFKMTSYGGPTYPVRVTVESWMKKVTERSNGRLQVEYYPDVSLYQNKEAFDATSKNVIQVSTSSLGYFPEKVDNPIADLMGMPFNWDFDKFGQRYRDRGNIYDITNESLKKLNLKLVAWGMNRGVEFASRTPMRNTAEFKGKMIRIGSGPKKDAISLLGATPSSIASEEVPTALERRTIDAGTNSIGMMISSKWYEVAPHITITDWGCGSVQVFMNLEFYNKLPSDLQKLMDDTWLEEEKQYFADFNGQYKKDTEFLKAQKGVNVYFLSEEDRAVWKKLLLPLWEKGAKTWGDKWPAVKAAVDYINK